MDRDSYDIVFVGAGLAAAATAFHLARHPARRGRSGPSVLLLEAERTPGVHASGRNASLFRQAEADPAVRRAAVASAPAFAELGERVGFRRIGSLLLGEEGRLERMRESEILPSRLVDREEAVRRVPPLAGHRFPAALLTPDDGVLETWDVLTWYLSEARGAGVEVALDHPVEEVRRRDGAWRLATPHGAVEAGVLVDAAGAWATRVARMAGLDGPPLVPHKRHLFVVDGVPGVDEGQPFVWRTDGPRPFYFRPESGGLLTSICDEEPADPGGSLETTLTPGIEERLAGTLLAELPAFADAEVRRAWSCHRTKTSDGRFLIGPHPEEPSFFWVAGLGGHGLGCSWEIGRVAARALTGGGVAEEFDPARFEPTPAPGP